jgi:hypothetical protein
MAVIAAAVLAVTGFHGIVTRGPTRPVCQDGVPCSEPAVGALLVFERRGRVAARVRAGAGGRYVVRLPPGYYTVVAEPTLRIGRGLRPRRVHVHRGVFGRLDFAIDTGIR